MVSNFKTKKKEIYIPLKKTIELVIKRVRELDIHMPLSYMAKMDMAGRFSEESLQPLREDVYDYLKVANTYRKIYFEYLKNSKLTFDRFMSKNGSFAPGVKQYESLKNQISESLLKSDGKVWITSYDQYLPTILQHAEKRTKEPRNGKKMYKLLTQKFDKDVMEIKRYQILTLKKSKTLLKELDLAMKNPELGWGEWHKEEE
jgi:hypothetical protein